MKLGHIHCLVQIYIVVCIAICIHGLLPFAYEIPLVSNSSNCETWTQCSIMPHDPKRLLPCLHKNMPFLALIMRKWYFVATAEAYVSPDPDVIQLFSCSTQLSMKFQLLMKLISRKA